MTQTGSVPRRQSLPHDVIWGPGRFSPDGQTLLIESARLSDHMLAVRPGRDDSIRSVHLKGDVPSRVVRTRVLGWVDDSHVLAAVHQSAGADRWQADADLALLTLDLDAGTADVAVVGGVDAGDTGSAFSVASDLLAVDIPTNDSGEPVPRNTVRHRTRSMRPSLTARDYPTIPGWVGLPSASRSVPQWP